jgi:shikimate dehydrogenase
MSPAIHQLFAQQVHRSLSYEKILGDEHRFEQQVTAFFTAGGKGLNVTLPFKQRAYAMANVHSDRCLRAGAANTLWVKDNNVHADNTDGIGFVRDIARYIALHKAKILILGAGGAARGIIHPLLDMQPEHLAVANRSLDPLKQLRSAIPQIDCLSLTELTGDFDVIINATSAGLSGEFFSLSNDILAHSSFFYDLSYKQNGETPFVHYARQAGCNAIDGLGMLVEQAAESFYLWHGLRPDTEQVLNQLRNLFL